MLRPRSRLHSVSHTGFFPRPAFYGPLPTRSAARDDVYYRRWRRQNGMSQPSGRLGPLAICSPCPVHAVDDVARPTSASSRQRRRLCARFRLRFKSEKRKRNKQHNACKSMSIQSTSPFAAKQQTQAYADSNDQPVSSRSSHLSPCPCSSTCYPCRLAVAAGQEGRGAKRCLATVRELLSYARRSLSISS